ncbi:outer membrane beta-barrel protein [Psychrilyobacter atlanticus]|uniref:outer membrane beta-barrel protein n=1 Tax=Psychrilyobacter atlanticus TaxID=271091 RepID=UPI000427A900|nr:outer membrane beta-barrel protein [Psychrilyobacter atlanticus]
MKKIKLLTLLTILTANTVYGAGRNIIEGRVGGSFNGKYKSIEENGTEVLGEDSEIGYEVILEGLKEVYPNTYMGLGIGYQKHGKAKDLNEKSGELYTSVPIYGAIKYQFNTDGTIQPFLKTNIGLSFNQTENGLRDIDEKVNPIGFYGAIGGGFEVDQFIVELAYQINTAKTDNNIEENIDHSRFTLGLGYRFDF